MNAGDAFFDTNVLLYLVSADTTKASRAEELTAAGGVISVQVLNEFADVTQRKHGAPWPSVREALAVARRLFRVQDTTMATHDRGIQIAERYRYRVHDSMIIAAALEAGCTMLYSEDMQHGQKIAGLTIRNPFTPR